MADERTKRIEQIYHLAIEKATATERFALLESACGDDSELRAAVDGLVAQNFKPKFYNHEVFIYSAKHRQGFVAAFRRDFKSDSKDTSMVIVTVYPMGRRKGLHSDTEVYHV